MENKEYLNQLVGLLNVVSHGKDSVERRELEILVMAEITKILKS